MNDVDNLHSAGEAQIAARFISEGRMAMIKHLVLILALLGLTLVSGAAHAFPADGTYKITASAAGIFCRNHGGIDSGGGSWGCMMPCGPNNSKLCNVNCVASACTITVNLGQGGTQSLPNSTGRLSGNFGVSGAGGGTSTGGGDGTGHTVIGPRIPASTGATLSISPKGSTVIQ